jgi:hypothetical protein
VAINFTRRDFILKVRFLNICAINRMASFTLKMKAVVFQNIGKNIPDHAVAHPKIY